MSAVVAHIVQRGNETVVEWKLHIANMRCTCLTIVEVFVLQSACSKRSGGREKCGCMIRPPKGSAEDGEIYEQIRLILNLAEVKMAAKNLVTQLRLRNLSPTGNKHVLSRRLVEYYQS
jgi:hypothetical protein